MTHAAIGFEFDEWSWTRAEVLDARARSTVTLDRPTLRLVSCADPSRASYTAGCRCSACRRANTTYIRRWRAAS